MYNNTVPNLEVRSLKDGGVVIERPFSAKEMTLTHYESQLLVKAIIRASNSSTYSVDDDIETPTCMFNVIFAGYTPVGVRTHQELLPFLPVVGMHFEWLNITGSDDGAQESIPMKVTSVEACKDTCEGCKPRWLHRVVLEMNEDQES